MNFKVLIENNNYKICENGDVYDDKQFILHTLLYKLFIGVINKEKNIA